MIEQQTEPTRQRVYIVDDDEALRDSLVWMLESHGFAATAFDSGEAFLAAWSAEMTGCLLLDVRMPGMSGIELFDELRACDSLLPVVFVTGHGDVPMAVAALKNGAADFIEKPYDDQSMLQLIEQCFARDRADREKHRQTQDAARLLELLTPREKEVLKLVIAGKLNKQIADVLDISIKTVEVHRARVMDKMQVNSLAELVQKVVAAEAGG